MIATWLLWMTTLTTVPLPAVVVYPIEGAIDVPLNAMPVVPLDEARHPLSIMLLTDDDGVVDIGTILQSVTMDDCNGGTYSFDVMRIVPTAPLLAQTHYRVSMGDPNSYGSERSFTTGDDEDIDPPLPPTAQPDDGVAFSCGGYIPIATEPQSVVVAVDADEQWIGFSTGASIALSGYESTSFSLMSLDVAGNFSEPQIVEVDFPLPSCGCQQRRGDVPSWMAIAAIAWMWLRRR